MHDPGREVAGSRFLTPFEMTQGLGRGIRQRVEKESAPVEGPP